jgi:hypothetical protein
MSEERIHELERSQRFWKRLALVAIAVLVLVILGSASLSGTLYYSLLEERAHWAGLEQQQIEAEQRAKREAERALRQVERQAREAREQLNKADRRADRKRD